MSWLKRVVPVGAVAAALVAGACSESTSPSTVSASASATAVTGLNTSLSQNGLLQALAALGNVAPLAAPVLRAGMAPLPAPGRPWTAAAAHTRDRLSELAGRAPLAPEALFPANVLGKTFQWDTATDSYRITDSTLTGAPSNGVEFLLYQVDTATGDPSLPLTQTGYLTIADASTPQANILHVLLKVNTLTAADYTITEVKTTSNLTLTAAGYVTNIVGNNSPVVNFTLQHVLSLPDSSLATNYQANSNGATVSLVDTVSGSGGSPSFALDWSVTKAGTVAIVGSGTDSAIDVQFKFNGTTVATASGPADNPSIALASGQTLTASDLLALASIFAGFAEIEYNLSLLFTPGLLVFG